VVKEGSKKEETEGDRQSQGQKAETRGGEREIGRSQRRGRGSDMIIYGESVSS
jgi:hypothetical protein